MVVGVGVFTVGATRSVAICLMSKARFRGSKFLTFRGHVLRSCVILLARAIAVSPWLGGPGCALPCFGFIGFRVSLCRVGCRIVGCRIVGCRIVGLLWKWVSAAFGNVLDQAGHNKSPKQAISYLVVLSGYFGAATPAGG